MATRSVPQPPFSAELLADLHADNVDPGLAARLWPVVRADADATGYLRDLDAVTARLHALGAEDRTVHRMPDDVADRLAAFVDGLGAGGLDAEDGASGVEPTERLTDIPRPYTLGSPGGNGVAASAPIPLRPRRRPAIRWAAAAAAAIAVLAGAGIGLRTLDTGAGTEAPPVAQPSPTTDVGDELTTTAALAALGRHEVSGPLGDAAALESCVRAAGLDRPVLGSMNLTFRGTEAVLILVAGPSTPKITALVVGPGCTVDDPQVLDITDIG